MSRDALPMLPISEVQRTGDCNRFCGRCCSVSLWEQHPLYHALLKPLFDELGRNERGDCLNLDWKHGMAHCAIYENRPEICRTFPNHPLSVELIPECTFRFHQKEEAPCHPHTATE